jgi:hypothetical protein
MRGSRLVLAAALAVVGGVWVGQGLGFIGGSFMTGSLFWGMTGAALLVLAVVILVMERRRR